MQRRGELGGPGARPDGEVDRPPTRSPARVSGSQSSLGCPSVTVGELGCGAGVPWTRRQTEGLSEGRCVGGRTREARLGILSLTPRPRPAVRPFIHACVICSAL